MALTITDVHRRVGLGPYWEKIVDINLGTYATNGVAIAPADIGFASSIDFIDFEVAQGSAVRSVTYDRTNGKVLAYAPGDAEVANSTNLSAVTVRARCVGR